MSIPIMLFENISCPELKGLIVLFCLSHCCAQFLCQHGYAGFLWFCQKKEVVHDVVEVLLKVVLCFFPEFCIHTDVQLHPAFLFYLRHPVHGLQFHALLQIKLQVPAMHDIVVFGLKCRQQLLAVREFHIQNSCVLHSVLLDIKDPSIFFLCKDFFFRDITRFHLKSLVGSVLFISLPYGC